MSFNLSSSSHCQGWREPTAAIPSHGSSPTLIAIDNASSSTQQVFPRLATNEEEFSILYREWYGAYMRNPLTAGPPPAPFLTSAPLHPPPRGPRPPPQVPTPRANSSTSSRSIGKSITAKPDTFGGDKSKYVQWWRTISLYLAGFEEEPTDEQKIIVVLSYMRGNNAAGCFADFYVTQGLLGSSNFAEFSAKIRDSFQPAMLQRTAEKELLSMKQGNETIEDFILKMKLLIIQANYSHLSDGRLLIDILRNGVHNEVVEYVERSRPELLESSSFSKWEDALVKADQVLHERAERKRETSANPPPRSFAPSSKSSTSYLRSTVYL